MSRQHCPSNLPIIRFSKAAGQMFDPNGSFGSGMLISPKLFLTAGHCVLPESGEYVLLSDGEEEFKKTIPLSGIGREDLMTLSNKEIAELDLKYSPDIKLEDVAIEEPIQELNRELEVSFKDKTGDDGVRIKGKVLCAIYNSDHSLDFALVELEESVNDIEIPELSTESNLGKFGYIFHYPRGGERTLSVAALQEPISDFHEFKLTYRADTKDQSSGSAILSQSGKIIGIHTDRDLLVEETLNDEELTKEGLTQIEERLSEMDEKFVHGVRISEILAFSSKATDKFINTLASNGVKVDGSLPVPNSATLVVASAHLALEGVGLLRK